MADKKKETKTEKPNLRFSQEEMKQMLKDQPEKAIGIMSKNMLEHGISPSETLKIPDEIMEGLYAEAYNLYNQGKYQDATYLFKFLVMMKGREYKYVLGLAATMHMKKEWVTAATMYEMASLLAMNNPVPLYHASDCYINADMIPKAIDALERAIERSEISKEYEILKKRAELTLKNLRRQQEEKTKEKKQKKE